MKSKEIKADLHCHSYHSDGALSPHALVLKAMEANVNLLALTDHDTISGLAELKEVAFEYDIHVINGVELSVRWKKHDIHILGLNINAQHMPFADLLTKQSNSRIARAREIGRLLSLVGIDDAYDKARAIAGHDNVARPHFAQLILNQGLVKTMQGAFKHYLGRGRVAYVPTEWITLEEAVVGIQGAGGEAVIAHPLKYKLTGAKLNALISEFKHVGGMGLEVVSGGMSPSEIKKIVALCELHEMLASTGSDFHNDSHSYIKLGRQQQLPQTVRPIWSQWDFIS